MKTAMQEFIEYLEETKTIDGILDWEELKLFLIKKEKMQIIKAHNVAVSSPYTDAWMFPTQGELITKGEKYYNENYTK